MPEEPEELDAFISYAHSDRKAASEIEQLLVTAGFAVWRDDSALAAGGRMRDRINDALRTCACVVIVLSPRSVSSPWVLNELDAAMLREIRERRTVVIPILIGRIDVADLPGDLQGKLYIDLRLGFAKRLRATRPTLIAAVRAATHPTDSDTETPIELGPALMGRILACRLVATTSDPKREEWEQEFPAYLADIFLEIYDADGDREIQSDFMEQYGQHGLRQVCLYLWGIRYRHFGELDTDSMWELMKDIRILLLMFGGVETFRAQGVTVMFGVSPGGQTFYRSLDARIDSPYG